MVTMVDHGQAMVSDRGAISQSAVNHGWTMVKSHGLTMVNHGWTMVCLAEDFYANNIVFTSTLYCYRIHKLEV